MSVRGLSNCARCSISIYTCNRCLRHYKKTLLGEKSTKKEITQQEYLEAFYIGMYKLKKFMDWCENGKMYEVAFNPVLIMVELIAIQKDLVNIYGFKEIYAMLAIGKIIQTIYNDNNEIFVLINNMLNL